MRQLSLFGSKYERDASLLKIERISFHSKAIPIIAALKPGEYTGEDIRIILSRKGIFPHHPNGWGALIMKALKMEILCHTGRTTNMKIKTSHARRNPIYVKEDPTI